MIYEYVCNCGKKLELRGKDLDYRPECSCGKKMERVMSLILDTPDLWGRP